MKDSHVARSFVCLTMLALVLPLVSAGSPTAEDAVKQAQGRWELESLIHDGRIRADPEGWYVGNIIVAERQFIATLRNGQKRTGRVEIIGDHALKVLKIVGWQGREDVRYAIYELDQGVLRICMLSEYEVGVPVELKPSRNVDLYTFRRQK